MRDKNKRAKKQANVAGHTKTRIKREKECVWEKEEKRERETAV